MGDLKESQILIASEILFLFKFSKILFNKSWVSIFTWFKYHSFSIIMAKAKTEHKSIGHITGPPARKIFKGVISRKERIYSIFELKFF
jgi:hypothetical protein